MFFEEDGKLLKSFDQSYIEELSDLLWDGYSFSFEVEEDYNSEPWIVVNLESVSDNQKSVKLFVNKEWIIDYGRVYVNSNPDKDLNWCFESYES